MRSATDATRTTRQNKRRVLQRSQNLPSEEPSKDILAPTLRQGASDTPAFNFVKTLVRGARASAGRGDRLGKNVSRAAKAAGSQDEVSADRIAALLGPWGEGLL